MEKTYLWSASVATLESEVWGTTQTTAANSAQSIQQLGAEQQNVKCMPLAVTPPPSCMTRRMDEMFSSSFSLTATHLALYLEDSLPDHDSAQR